jgi:hypothetical protein
MVLKVLQAKEGLALTQASTNSRLAYYRQPDHLLRDFGAGLTDPDRRLTTCKNSVTDRVANRI